MITHPYITNKFGKMIVSYETDKPPKITGLSFDFSEDKGLRDLYVNGKPGKFEDFIDSGFTEKIGLKYDINELEFETYQLLLMQNLSKYMIQYFQKPTISESAKIV